MNFNCKIETFYFIFKVQNCYITRNVDLYFFIRRIFDFILSSLNINNIPYVGSCQAYDCNKDGLEILCQLSSKRPPICLPQLNSPINKPTRITKGMNKTAINLNQKCFNFLNIKLYL